MKITVDKEGMQLIKQVQDALLRGHGVTAIPMFNELEKVVQLDRDEVPEINDLPKEL